MESRAKLLGHPIHPMLIVLPLGLFIGAVAAMKRPRGSIGWIGCPSGVARLSMCVPLVAIRPR